MSAHAPSSVDPLAGMFQDALRLHQAGKLDAAEALYQRILVLQRKHVDTLHLLGVSRHQRGDFQGAMKHLRAALKLRPELAQLHLSYGNVLREMDQLPEATKSYERASRIAPQMDIAHYNLGTALEAAGRYAEALKAFERAHALRANAATLAGRANCLLALGRPDEAIADYRRVLELDPQFADGWANLGAVLVQRGDFEAAWDALERALRLHPEHNGAKLNRALLLNELQRPAEALQQLDSALAAGTAAPVRMLRQRARALSALNRVDEAIDVLERALTLDPSDRDLRFELAAALTSHGERSTAATALLDDLLAQNPDDMRALLNRGTVLLSIGNYAQARAHFERVAALEPTIGMASFNLAFLDLLEGKFKSGFRGYEERWADPAKRGLRRTFAQEMWLGDGDLGGATLFVHAEQGFGDTLQFCRYLLLLQQRAKQVIFEVPGSLFMLMRHCMPPGIAIVPQGKVPPAFDRHIPLGSAPLALGTTLENLPPAAPYLAADGGRVEIWRNRLRYSTRFRVGLAWSGNPGHSKDRQRSIALALLRPLIEEVNAGGTRKIEFLALQNQLRTSDREVLADLPALHYFGEAVEDFADTAALVALCDVVICVDTAAAHLAGAMGKVVWLLLPYVPDWRWLLERADSPWYPSMRLFRQRRSGEWGPVLEDVSAALHGLASAAGAQ